MEIILTLNLQDDEGTSHDKVDIEFSDEVMMKQVMEEIKSKWSIDKRYQELTYNEVRISDLDFTLKQLDLKEEDEIIVKHVFADHWTISLRRYKQLKILQKSYEQDEMAHSLLEAIQMLTEKNFFTCYPKIQEVNNQISPEIREYLGGFRGKIEAAARYYFFDLKKNDRENPSIFKICFNDKPAGVHSGRLCTVIDYDGESNFHIKTNHAGPVESNSSSRMAPNLREIFGYSLLQIIGVGPESHFICPPPVTATRTMLIATKAIPDFDINRMDKFTSKTENIKTILIEIHTLCSIFCITDIHQDNCGHFNMEPIIIDFAIPFKDGYQHENVMQIICEGTPSRVDTLVNGVENEDLRKVADECSSEERFNIAKTALKRWNLMDTIEKAKARTKEVEELMRSQGVEIERADDFEKYIADVKYNCSLLL